MRRIYTFLLICIFSVLFSQTNYSFVIKDNLGNDSRNYSCSSPFTAPLTLTATSPQLRATTGYNVSALPSYTPIVPLNSGTALNASDNNNSYLSKIDIGFDFCFYGNKYSQLVVGTNGVVTFDTSYEGQVIFPVFSQSNPNVLLPNNAVFGVFQAMLFDGVNGSDVYVQRTGTAPNRKVIISFYNAKFLYTGATPDCDKRTSSQIILNETTNQIQVYIEDKPLPCGDSVNPNALVGVQNLSGDKGVSPPGRNTGVWQATNEAWNFVPNGTIITPKITWYNTFGTALGTGATLNISSVSGLDDIRAEAVYNLCGNSFVTTDTFPVTFSSAYPSGTDFTATVCSGGAVNLTFFIPNLTSVSSTGFNFKFYKSLSEAQSGIGTEYKSDNITANTTYYLRVENKTNTACFNVYKLNIRLIVTALQTTTVSVCESEKTNYLLSNFNKQLLGTTYKGTVTYYMDAAGTSTVTRANLTDGMQLWIKLTGCPDILGPITVKLNQGPPVTIPPLYTASMCDNDANGLEPFVFSSFDAQIVSDPTLYTITYHGTYNDAVLNRNEIFQVRDGNYNVYARVEDTSGGGCASIVTINLNITFTKIVANNADIYFCFDGTSDRVISDLTTNPVYIAGMGGSGTVTFHALRNDAITGLNPITTFTLTQDGSYTTETVYVRFTEGTCYTGRELRFHQVKPENRLTTALNICDSNNDGTETVTLSAYNNQIAKGQRVTITYFTDNTYSTPTTTLNLVPGTNTVYLEIKSNFNTIDGPCIVRSTITINLTPGPAINPGPIVINRTNVCDNNNDGFELFDVTSQYSTINPSGLSLRYEFYTGYNAATNAFTGRITLISGKFVKISNNTPTTIYVKATSGTCFSKSEIVVTYNFNTNSIVLHPAKVENCSLSNTIVFDLDSAKSQQFIQAENAIQLSDIVVEYYKDYDQVTEQLSNQITSPYTTGRSQQRVYAKYISSSTGCYSVAPIDLITYLSPIGKSITKSVCEFTGIDLNTLKDGTLLDAVDPAATYIYKFYLQNPGAATQPIDDTKIFYPQNNQRIWYKVTVQSNNPLDCDAIGTIDFTLLPQMPLSNRGPFIDDKTCDVGNDGIETVTTLRQFESIVKQEYPNATFAYYESFPDKPINPDSYLFDSHILQKVIMVITNGSACPVAVDIQIKLKKTPAFTLKNGDYRFCKNGGWVDIIPNSSKIYQLGLQPKTYIWTLPNGTKVTNQYPNSSYRATESGNYSLTIIADNGCSHTESFTVKAYETPEIYKIVVEGNKVTVLATSPDNSRRIMYSYDGLNSWSYNYIFYNVPPGIRTFYVRYENNQYENGCIGMPMKDLILEDTNVITPNGDGLNDKWTIKHLDIFDGQNSNLKIFDRYNKLLYEQTSATELSWDGYYDGRVLPTSSYWYVLTLPDGRQQTGWILVKNID